MEQLWLAEPNWLVGYLERIENATTEDRRQAEALFDDIIPPDENLPEILSFVGDEAIIKIEGVLTRSGPSRLDRFFGFKGTGFNDIIKSLEIAGDNEQVKTIRMLMNTPGGTIDGTDATFQAVLVAKARKKVVAENHGLLASAGYWIAAGSNKITAMSPDAETGSIGVAIIAIDFSKLNEEMGIKIVRIVSQNAPKKFPDISKKSGISILQKQVNGIESVFIDRISQGRKLTVGHIKEKFGQGDILIAQDFDDNPGALSVGMIDSIESPTKPVTTNNKGVASASHNDELNDDLSVVDEAKHHKNAEQTKQRKEKIMNLEQFLAENPSAKAEFDAKLAEIKNQGIQAGMAKVEARIKKVTPILAADSEYPSAIQGLAVKVLEGAEEPAALTGAITIFDAQKEETAAQQATEETNAAGETTAQQQATASADGQIANEVDLQAAADRLKR